MPVNALIVRALLQYYMYYGDAFTIECPTGSGRQMTLYEVAEEITRRLASIFLRDQNGRRPVYREARKFQEDPHWRDLILFYEYFHGDNGTGLGACHQTGWTGVIARAMHLFATSTAEQVRELGKAAAFPETQPARSGQTESAPQAARLEMREPLHPPPVGAVPTKLAMVGTRNQAHGNRTRPQRGPHPEG